MTWLRSLLLLFSVEFTSIALALQHGAQQLESSGKVGLAPQAAPKDFYSSAFLLNPFEDVSEGSVAGQVEAIARAPGPGSLSMEHPVRSFLAVDSHTEAPGPDSAAMEHLAQSLLGVDSEADGGLVTNTSARIELTATLPPYEHFAPTSSHGLGYMMALLSKGKRSVQSDAQKALARSRPTVWVHGYGRSGSSTVMTMFSEAWPHENVFAQFEPCHRKDQFRKGWENVSCGQQILHYSACDFSIVKSMHGWSNKRSTTQSTWLSWTMATSVSNTCSRSSALVYKTISHPFEVFRIRSEVLPVLRQEPRLRFIEVIRDPRSIYASMLTTEPFRTRDLHRQHNVTVMTDICDSFALNIHVSSPGMHRLVFEDLLDAPVQTMRAAYEFLGVEFQQQQYAWIRETLNTRNCLQEQAHDKHYKDCHTKLGATRSRQHWRQILELAEQAIFLRRPSCRMVASFYNYTLAFYLPSR